MNLSERDVNLILQGLKAISISDDNLSDDDKRKAKDLEDKIGSQFSLGAEIKKPSSEVV